MAKESVERRLAAVLAADVVGYTRLMGADEAGTLLRLNRLRKQVLEPLIAAHRGRIVKLIGDGLLVEFASVVDAVTCALAWQQAVGEHEADCGEQAFAFRIGVNLGDLIVEEDDIYGDGVNVAARLEGMAEPGGICLSSDAYRQVRGKIDTGFEDLGEHTLKNVEEPVRMYRTAAIGPVPPTARGRNADARGLHKPSVAVLPFVNMSDDPEQEYFSEGITEDIITELSRFHSLFVIARNSTFAYKGRALKVQEVGRDLGVRYVVEGSVRKAGKRVRITAQLVETTDGNHLWADHYDRDLDDIFAVQDDVVQRTVTTLARRVEDVTRQRSARRPPENMDAYDYVLRGYPYVLRVSEPEDTARAREMLEKALLVDPDYGRAHALLALSHLVDVFMFWAEDPGASLARAFEIAQRAVQLDSSDNVTHWVLGQVLLFERQFNQAALHIERSLALNPNDADVRAVSCFLYTCLGEAAKGLAYGVSAMERNPYYPDWYPWMLAIAYYDARKYQKAIDTLDAARSLNVNMHRIRAMALAQLDEADAAQREVAQILALQPGFCISEQLALLPFKEQATVDHFAEGMRKAGFPEHPAPAKGSAKRPAGSRRGPAASGVRDRRHVRR